VAYDSSPLAFCDTNSGSPGREVAIKMSSRPLLIAGFLGSIFAGVALFVLALMVVASDGEALSGQSMAVLILGVMLGFVLDSVWLCLTVSRLSKLGQRGDGEDDSDGKGPRRPAPEPGSPPPSPSAEPEWWPEFERELREYGERQGRVPAGR
jgi:hypothetical protein